MPTHDSTAAAALANEVRYPAFFVYLDILGDPIRATDAGYSWTFAGTGDADLDGFTFSPIDPQVIDVGAVTFSESGSETLTLTLSAIAGVDTDLLDDIDDKAKWQTRAIRLWKLERSASGAAEGAIVPYFTGYMSSVEFDPSPGGTVIRLNCEHYLAAITAQASNRSYLGQSEYDPADTSAKATIACANGASAGPGRATAAPSVSPSARIGNEFSRL